MRASFLSLLLGIAMAGSHFAADTDGLAAGATLGLQKITMEEQRDDDTSAKRFILHVPIKARPKTHIDLGDLVIVVLFYDLVDGKDVAATSADVKSHWATRPPDWTDSDTEELAVEYRLPNQEARAGKSEDRKYFGYIVRVYYKGKLQASTADPERLGHQYPPPPTLPKDADRSDISPAARPGVAVTVTPQENSATASSPPAKRAAAQGATLSSFAAHAQKLRDDAMLQMEPKLLIPTKARAFGGRYPWKTGIVTTVFYVGYTNHGKANHNASAWDPAWLRNFGGVDNPDPAKRRDYIPTNFIPRLNPFYIALPYNDVTHGATKPEAALAIPWFKEADAEAGNSVCRDRWVAIRNSAGKTCYAQWSDCGPFGTDHYQYVFGAERPKPNANQGSGLDVSPAVRDYLSLARTDVTDWKFVDFHEIPGGPWARYGENNPFVLQARQGQEHPINAPSAPANPAPSTPIGPSKP
jgi:hypothetical protein